MTKKVVWTPLAGSQALAIACPCNTVFYEGTRGPGKTDAQLMAFRKLVGQGYGHFWRGVIFDREYKNLDDIVSKSKRWFPQFNDGARFLSAGKDYKWVWPTGEELLFRALEREEDYWKYHGQEFPFIGWNELTKFATPKLFNAMMSCNRSSFVPAEHSPRDNNGHISRLLPELPLVIFATSNPYGPGHNWVKRRFIDPAPPGQVVRTMTEVFNPRNQRKESVERTQVRLFGSYKENKYLSPVYVATLTNEPDPNKRKAWLEGDWDIVAGGALDDVWCPEKQVLTRFKIPKGWRLDRSMDWGSAQPFSVGWWAEANGEEVELPDGTVFCPPPGSLIRIFEWYGSKEIGTNEGITMSARDVARGILAREAMLRERGWICGNVNAGPADNAIRNVIERDTETIEAMMADEGVHWDHSDKSPGSRINGLELLRGRLHNTKTGVEGAPGLYIFDCCRASISTLPVLPRDPNKPEDVDTTSEDHVYDEVRYRVLAGSNRIPKNFNTSFIN